MGVKSFARKRYEKQYAIELRNYDMYRKILKSFIRGEDKRILPKEWQKQMDKFNDANTDVNNSLQKTVSVLAAIEVLQFNKKDLQRMIENESHKKAVSIEKNNIKSID